jgi:hypothetical protein
MWIKQAKGQNLSTGRAIGRVSGSKAEYLGVTITAPRSSRSGSFWGLVQRTPEGDKLDILVTLVETYWRGVGQSKVGGGLTRSICCIMQSKNSATVRRSLQTFWVHVRARPKWLGTGP